MNNELAYNIMCGLLVVVTAGSIYFMPAIISFSRKMESAWGVMALNLLLGWTLIGWIASFVWAFVGKKRLNES